MLAQPAAPRRLPGAQGQAPIPHHQATLRLSYTGIKYSPTAGEESVQAQSKSTSRASPVLPGASPARKRPEPRPGGEREPRSPAQPGRHGGVRVCVCVCVWGGRHYIPTGRRGGLTAHLQTAAAARKSTPLLLPLSPRPSGPPCPRMAGDGRSELLTTLGPAAMLSHTDRREGGERAGRAGPGRAARARQVSREARGLMGSAVPPLSCGPRPPSPAPLNPAAPPSPVRPEGTARGTLPSGLDPGVSEGGSGVWGVTAGVWVTGLL